MAEIRQWIQWDESKTFSDGDLLVTQIKKAQVVNHLSL
jgi:hypothetical protein